MTGHVDSNGRALIPITIRPTNSTKDLVIDVWIDTGFTGDLVIPKSLLTSFNLGSGQIIRAVLADGSVIDLESHSFQLDWFGMQRLIEVVGNNGMFPLLGVGLMLGHSLHIDYRLGTVELL